MNRIICRTINCKNKRTERVLDVRCSIIRKKRENPYYAISVLISELKPEYYSISEIDGLGNSTDLFREGLELILWPNKIGEWLYPLKNDYENSIIRLCHLAYDFNTKVVVDIYLPDGRLAADLTLDGDEGLQPFVSGDVSFLNDTYIEKCKKRLPKWKFTKC